MKEVTNLFSASRNLSKIKFERQVSAYLQKNLTPQDIFKKIQKKQQPQFVCQFLYNAGLYKTLIEFAIQQIQKEQPISWGFVLKALLQTKTPIKELEFKHLFNKWLKNMPQNEFSLFACKKLRSFDSFDHLIQVYLDEYKEKNMSEEDKLVEKLNFVKSKNLIDEESVIIKKLLSLNPENPKYKAFKKSLEQERAIQVVQKQKNQKASHRSPAQKHIRFTPEQSPFKNKLSTLIEKASQNKQASAKNLALFCYFLEWPEVAIDVFKDRIEKRSDWWFYLEWLMETKQHTTCLDVVNQWLSHLEDDFDSLFPLNYIKAQNLYHLGQKEEAIQHLTSILNVRPNYKSAQFLLEKWNEE